MSEFLVTDNGGSKRRLKNITANVLILFREEWVISKRVYGKCLSFL